MRKMNYVEMRSAGLCTCCGKPNQTPERSLCPSCRERKNESKRSNNEYFKKIGVCVRCKKNQAEPHKTLCYECIGKASDDYAEKGRTPEQRETDKERKRILAARRLESGLCPRCGKYPAINYGLCKRCRAYNKRYRDSHRNDLFRSDRRSYGICYICGKNKVLPGKGVCQSCYDVRLKTIPAMLANQNTEYFQQLNYAFFIRNKYSKTGGAENECINS